MYVFIYYLLGAARGCWRPTLGSSGWPEYENRMAMVNWVLVWLWDVRTAAWTVDSFFEEKKTKKKLSTVHAAVRIKTYKLTEPKRCVQEWIEGNLG